MIPELVHVPWGDHHPYDPVPWARAPRQPATDEAFRVGARATVDVDGVVVEWQAGTARGVTPLERSQALTWTGTLGPWSQPGRYRFLVPSDPGVSSSWFEVAPVDWTDVAFTAVRVQDGRFVVVAPDGRLMLTPDGESSLAWILDGGDGEVTGDADAEISGWTVTVAGGEVSLSGPIDRVVTVRRGVANGETVSWRLGWHLDDSEVLLGTGERFDALDQRGRRPDVRVYEQYKQQGSRTYFPLPWVLSTAGYGLAVDGAARVHFDLGAVDPSHASLTVPTPEAAGRFYAGSPREALRRYLDDVGRPGPLPVWAYGPWMSGNEWDRDTVVRGVVERSDAEGIPATVLVIEAWSDETTFYLFNDTAYAPVPGAEPIPAGGMRHGGRWPDPRGLVEWLHDRDLRVLLWQIPVLKDVTEHPQHEADIAHVDAAGLAVTTDDGRPYRNRGWWFPDSRIIDFTNPAARDWWFMKRRYLIDDIGVDGFKTDGGEHLWGDDVVTADGTAGDAAANGYPTRYLEAYHEFMRSAEVDRPVTFSRAGFAGSQAYPAHWAGDEDSTWEAFRASLVAGLSAAMCGVAFWSWDLAGFSGPLPSAELYKRAAAMAAFSPIMQYHSEHNDHRRPLADRTPWNVADHTGDARVVDVYRFYARLRMNLVPLLVTLGEHATATGDPIIRPLAYHHPQDPVAARIEDQFLLGDDLMVAPVMTEGVDQRRVYLPGPGWRDLWTGDSVAEGWATAPAGDDTIPVYLRSGGVVPLWLPNGMLELGAPVGLPGGGDGRLVLLVDPGTGRHELVDPITLRPWHVAVDAEGSSLRVETSPDAPAIDVWVLGTARSSPIPSGGGSVTIEVGDER